MTRIAARAPALAALLALALCSGCAAQKSYVRAERDMQREDYDRAVLEYSKALALHPGNTRYAVALERAKLKASAEHFTRARRYQEAGQLELAVAEFQQTLLLNPSNQHADSELRRALRELRRRDAGPSTIEALKEKARRRDAGPPKLDPRSNIPILLNFKEIELEKIFEAIGKASGINYIFDDKVDLDKPMTVDIGNVSLEKALDILMLQTKNFYKVIDEYTLLIAPDTRQKRQEYEDQVIRTFFLSNAETKTVVTLLRSLLQSRQIAENPELNSVTIKDTPPKVAIAERIIQANDKARGEVVIDVELLEINRTLTETLGIDLSSKTLTLQFGDGSESLPLNNLDPVRQSANWTIGVIPSVTLDFLKSDSDSKTIAKPQVRVSEGERGEILIGDRVPIPTTSFNTSQTVGGNIVPITSFTYQNVGITVQIEPRVHHNKEVTLKVQVEVSQVTGSVSTGGSDQPIIGTRQIQTVIRLRDGETNMLAGLIQQADQNGISGVPGLMDTPLLRRLFTRQTKTRTETDIVMTLTPRIVRIPDITEDDLAPLWVGTEENMQLRGAARAQLDQGPFGRADSPPEEQDEDLPPSPVERGTRGSLSRTAASDEDEEGFVPDPQDEVAPELPGEEPPSPPGAVPDAPADDAAERDAGEAEQPSTYATVRLQPSKPVYRVGEAVTVHVMIENGGNVGSVPFHLRYDPAVLQYLGDQEGPFLESDGKDAVFLAVDSGGGGEIVVGASRLGPGTGVSGSGLVGSFNFTAVGPGACGFQFTGASVKDPQARNLPATFNTAVVQVQP